MTSVVQSASGDGNLHLGSAIGAGHTLIYACGERGGVTAWNYTADGWSLGTDGETTNTGPNAVMILYKGPTTGAESQYLLGHAGVLDSVNGTLYEVDEALTVDQHNQHAGVGFTLTSNTIVAQAGFVVGVGAQGVGGGYDSVANAVTYTIGAGWTKDLDHFTIGGHPTVVTGHRFDAGTYAFSATNDLPSGDDWIAQVLSFVGAPAAPTPGMWTDFARDGFTEAGGAPGENRLTRQLPETITSAISDNITADVISVRIDRTVDRDGGTAISTMTFVTKNTGGKYNPDNTSSAFYGLLEPGMPVWFGCGNDLSVSGSPTTVFGRFAGYLKTLAPIPVQGAADAPTVEWVCEDAFGRFQDAKARVAFSSTRTVATYRTAVLAAIGETRIDLATEADTLPASGEVGITVASLAKGGRLTTRQILAMARDQLAKRPRVSALSVLEDLNRLVGTRHFIAPAADKADFYSYTTRNRRYKLNATADAAIVSMVSDTSGYVHSRDGVENSISVEVRPFRVASQPSEVWSFGELPFAIDPSGPRTIVADFGDVVFGASVVLQSSGGNVSAAMVSYGTGAVLILTSVGIDTVTGLSIDGRAVTRLESYVVEDEDAGSKLAYGEMAAASPTSDLMTSGGLAEGIAAYHMWANARPRKTPSVVIWDEAGARATALLPLELLDVVTYTEPQLDVSAKRFEITGIHEEWAPGSAALGLVKMTLDLRQTPNASALQLIRFDTSTYGGSDIFAP